jgi:UDP-N-acetyl-2-amino-2-deoxyglucuronate dehydrogenase
MKFALIGAAGYVAPRHMKAIKDVGGDLVAALDPHDSVGVLDQHFPGCLYFREPERFDRWLSKNPVDYVVVCSPNYLHDAHCLMAMRNGCAVICEKPLVLNERNLDNLSEWQVRTGQKVNVILQCRLHPQAMAAKACLTDAHTFVHVEYRTPRGPWYQRSWKGDVEKSGGIATNIGIHLFDLCTWLFGDLVNDFELFLSTKMYHTEACGTFALDRATVNWFLSVDPGRPVRKFDCAEFSLDLSGGFTDLHTKSYEEILNGRGFGIEDVRPATRIVERIRKCR